MAPQTHGLPPAYARGQLGQRTHSRRQGHAGGALDNPQRATAVGPARSHPVRGLGADDPICIRVAHRVALGLTSHTERIAKGGPAHD